MASWERATDLDTLVQLPTWTGLVDISTKDDLELFQACTGRSDAPMDGFTQAWLCCGRRSGKSRMLAMTAAYLSVFRDWSPYLSPGQVPTVIVCAADRRQARVIFRYCREFLKALYEFSIGLRDTGDH